ncbi:GNAT family N-acetyltransferase [Streptomyces sp. NPDC051172]|uniref:GNAT family N-acetyltransferase n=1 Tax=Streptomyces sp. NPDC051172 TaxID=3155796 RepID=UPI0034268E26
MTTEQTGPTMVRSAIENDIPGLVECSSALFAEDAGRHDSAINTNWPREHGADRFASGLSDPARLILAAVTPNEGVVGYLTGAVSEPTPMTTITTATLTAMWVHPEHRGNGTGGQLVHQFLAWAKAQHADQAEVTAYTANERARRFYARHGFTPHTVTVTHPL